MPTVSVVQYLVLGPTTSMLKAGVFSAADPSVAPATYTRGDPYGFVQLVIAGEVCQAILVAFAVGLGSSSSEPSNQSETSRIPTITASASPKRTFSPAPMMLTSGADMNGAAEMLSPTSKLLDDANKLAEKAAKKRKHYDMSKEPGFLEQAEKLEKEAQDLHKQALARSPC